jgi:hypothetical protein
MCGKARAEGNHDLCLLSKCFKLRIKKSNAKDDKKKQMLKQNNKKSKNNKK